MKKALYLLLIFFPGFVYAGDASHCVSVGSGDRSQTLTNNCNQKIEVVWCHTLNKRGYRGLCKSDGKYYQKHTVLKPGEVKENQYSLPVNSTIYYGACTGGYYSTKQSGMNGQYRCK